MLHEPDDLDLVRACRDGDDRAFGVLVRRYQTPVYNAALRMVRDREDARDIAQTAFLKAWEQLGTFDSRFRFYSWLYRIAINEALNQLRTGSRRAPVADASAASVRDPSGEFEAAETGRRVQEALMRLKPDHRAVVVARHFLECSYADIATIVGVPEKTVKSRLFSARQELRLLLEGMGILP